MEEIGHPPPAPACATAIATAPQTRRTIIAMRPRLLVLALACATGSALAVESCELNGQHVNPANGNTTAGKSGLMRCRDGEGGPVVREQELKNGVFTGVVRYFRDGQLEREHRVNERGNREGLAREYAVGGGKAVLVREETYRDGRGVGIVRTWYPSGQLRRVGFRDDEGRELAFAEFTEQGKLYELRCAARPVLGGDADDARWCGHVGGPSNVALYNGKGVEKGRVSYDRGEPRKSEQLGESGTVREQHEATASGGVDRAFYDDGTKRREVQWVLQTGGDRARRVTTLEQEFHESGKLVRERRFRVGERGGELASERTWYLNGQPKETTELTVAADGRQLRHETEYHDNGKKAFEGEWRVAGASDRRGSAQPIGVHRSWDGEGRLRGERFYDERGRVARERELDASGAVVRDDEVFEDGSRKAFGR
jgi:antitoxin component YwqK of YwqJK toxin-antitoxin module